MDNARLQTNGRCGAVVFCDESFEAILYLFLIENEIWYSANDGTPMNEDSRRERFADRPS